MNSIQRVFLEKVKADLKNDTDLKMFTCVVTFYEAIRTQFINSKKHSNIPEHSDSHVQVELNMLLADGGSSFFKYAGLNFEEFKKHLVDSKKFALPYPVKMEMTRFSNYPKLDLTEQSLNMPEADLKKEILKLAQNFEKAASLIKHLNLMSHETSVHYSKDLTVYFDSVGNDAEQDKSSINLACVYYLSDTAEYFDETYGKMPSADDIRHVVAEASKNLQKKTVKKLEASDNLFVLLTPKIVGELVAEFILDNVDGKTILDESGAWAADDLGTKVVDKLTIIDDPHVPFSPHSRVFDGEGVPTQKCVIIKDGILSHPLFTRASFAAFLAIHPTQAASLSLLGNAANSTLPTTSNLLVDVDYPEFENFEELVSSQKNVAVINSLTGCTNDPITGQFVMDAEGVRVYIDGNFVYSTSLSLRGNFFELFAQPDNKKGPKERHTSVVAPSILTSALSCVAKEMS